MLLRCRFPDNDQLTFLNHRSRGGFRTSGHVIDSGSDARPGDHPGDLGGACRGGGGLTRKAGVRGHGDTVMTDRFRLMLGQLNPRVGDFAFNLATARRAHAAAKGAGADMLLLPEMFITGYQVQDLVLKPAFTRDAAAAIESLASETREGPAIGVGAPIRHNENLHNAFYVLKGGDIHCSILKHHLPNTDVFDEQRHFIPGPISGPYSVSGVRLGSPICEDAWHSDVCETLAETGAEILVVPNGSPFRRGKYDERMSIMVARVVESGLPLVYLNMVGGQDDQVFDGGSFVLDPGGRLRVQLPQFEELLEPVDFRRTDVGWRADKGRLAVLPDGTERDYQLMVLALRDYALKSGFSKVLLGLSGGVDSSLVAAIACDALGPGNVRCVLLPSVHTSDESREDAGDVVKRLGCRFDVIPIVECVRVLEDSLESLFAGRPADITEENIQSRVRGLLLMALSNKFGEMLLSTGNKSEVAVGYATIYGDMAGGYNPIKDLYKTGVFEACRWRNDNHRSWMQGPATPVIPDRVIEKPPSAELRPGQKDEDSLPPYAVLDAILERLIEEDASVSDCVADGFDRDTVRMIEGLIYASEYKRHQSAPGARLSRKAFWLDRRYPIQNRWRDGS